MILNVFSSLTNLLFMALIKLIMSRKNKIALCMLCFGFHRWFVFFSIVPLLLFWIINKFTLAHSHSALEMFVWENWRVGQSKTRIMTNVSIEQWTWRYYNTQLLHAEHWISDLLCFVNQIRGTLFYPSRKKKIIYSN